MPPGRSCSSSVTYPFGEVRDLPNDKQPKISATDFGYTGQRALDAQGNSFSLGLMDYKARFYDAALGRFTQPDTITPGGPQGLNRYGYVFNLVVQITHEQARLYLALQPALLPFFDTGAQI